MRTSASRSTVRRSTRSACSCVTVIACSTHGRRSTAAKNPSWWCSTCSTSPRTDVRKRGRTHRKAGRNSRPTNGCGWPTSTDEIVWCEPGSTEGATLDAQAARRRSQNGGGGNGIDGAGGSGIDGAGGKGTPGGGGKGTPGGGGSCGGGSSSGS